jgi:hypothetical protein
LKTISLLSLTGFYVSLVFTSITSAQLLISSSQNQNRENLKSLITCQSNEDKNLIISTRYDGDLNLNLVVHNKIFGDTKVFEKTINGIKLNNKGVEFQLENSHDHQIKFTFDIEANGRFALLEGSLSQKKSGTIFECRNINSKEIEKNYSGRIEKSDSNDSSKKWSSLLKVRGADHVLRITSFLNQFNINNLGMPGERWILKDAPIFLLDKRTAKNVMGPFANLEIKPSSTVVSHLNELVSPFDISVNEWEFYSYHAGVLGLDLSNVHSEMYQTGLNLKNLIVENEKAYNLRQGFLYPNSRENDLFNDYSQYRLQGEELSFRWRKFLSHVTTLFKNQSFTLSAINREAIEFYGTEVEWEKNKIQFFINFLLANLNDQYAQKLLFESLSYEVINSMENQWKYIPVLWNEISRINDQASLELLTVILQKIDGFQVDSFNKYLQNLEIQNLELMTSQREVLETVGVVLNSNGAYELAPNKKSLSKEDRLLICQVMGVDFLVNFDQEQKRYKQLNDEMNKAISLFLQFVDEERLPLKDIWNEKIKSMAIGVYDFKALDLLKNEWVLKIKSADGNSKNVLLLDVEKLWSNLVQDSIKMFETEISQTPTRKWKRGNQKLSNEQPIIGFFPYLISEGFRLTLGTVMVDPINDMGLFLRQMATKYSRTNKEKILFALSVGGASFTAGLAMPFIAQGMSVRSLVHLGAGTLFYKGYELSGLSEKVQNWANDFKDTEAGILGLTVNTIAVTLPALVINRKISLASLKFLAPRWLAMNSAFGAMSTLDSYADYLLEHEQGDFVSFVTSTPNKLFGNFGRTSIQSAPYMFGLMFVGGKYQAIALGSELTDFHSGFGDAVEEFKVSNNDAAFFARTGAVILDLIELSPSQIAHTLIKAKKVVLGLNPNDFSRVDKKDFDKEILPQIISYLASGNQKNLDTLILQAKKINISEQAITQLVSSLKFEKSADQWSTYFHGKSIKGQQAEQQEQHDELSNPDEVFSQIRLVFSDLRKLESGSISQNDFILKWKEKLSIRERLSSDVAEDKINQILNSNSPSDIVNLLIGEKHAKKFDLNLLMLPKFSKTAVFNFEEDEVYNNSTLRDQERIELLENLLSKATKSNVELTDNQRQAVLKAHRSPGQVYESTNLQLFFKARLLYAAGFTKEQISLAIRAGIVGEGISQDLKNLLAIDENFEEKKYRAAFGYEEARRTKNPTYLQFGFESEYTLDELSGLVEVYGPDEGFGTVSSQWFEMSVPDRTEWIKNHINELFATKRTAGRLVKLKSNTKYSFLPDHLILDSTNNVEIILKPITTIEGWYQAVSNINKWFGVGSMQGTVSVPTESFFGFTKMEEDKFIDRNLGYFKFMQDFDTLLKLQNGAERFTDNPQSLAAKSFNHPFLGPMTALRFSMLERYIRQNAVGEHFGQEKLEKIKTMDSSFKYTGGTVYRPDIVGADRIVLEVRDAHKNMAVLVNRLMRSTYFLMKDRNQFLKYNSLTVFDSEMSWSLVPQEIQELLKTLFPSKNSFDHPVYELYRNFSYPLRDWSGHIALFKNDNLGEKVREAQNRYLEKLSNLAQMMRNASEDHESLKIKAQAALAQFSVESRLAESISTYYESLLFSNSFSANLPENISRIDRPDGGMNEWIPKKLLAGQLEKRLDHLTTKFPSMIKKVENVKVKFPRIERSFNRTVYVVSTSDITPEFEEMYFEAISHNTVGVPLSENAYHLRTRIGKLFTDIWTSIKTTKFELRNKDSLENIIQLTDEEFHKMRAYYQNLSQDLASVVGSLSSGAGISDGGTQRQVDNNRPLKAEHQHNCTTGFSLAPIGPNGESLFEILGGNFSWNIHTNPGWFTTFLSTFANKERAGILIRHTPLALEEVRGIKEGENFLWSFERR